MARNLFSVEEGELEEESSAHGLLIPGHHVIRRISETAVSQVYLGRQIDPPREVAIKVLRQGDQGDAGLLERFQQEIRIGSSLGERGCVPVFQSGSTGEGGVFYFTMELMRGGTICEYANQMKLNTHDRVRLFLPLCVIVTAAHRVPILHRDLKPGNVLVTEDGKVKPGDFGLAKFLAKEEEGITLQTGVTQLGTPVYMAPEQARGEAVSTLSDVYGLGAVLYELLTGRRPFSEEGGTYPTMLRVAEKPMRDPEGIPSDLKAILDKAMAKLPPERYQSATALGDDLEAFLQGEPIVARKGQTFYRVRKKLRKHWPALAVAVAVAILITAGSFFHYQRIAERNAAARDSYLEARSLLETMVVVTAKELSESGRNDLAEQIALRSLEFDWSLPIGVEGNDPALNPASLRMEAYALNGALARGHDRTEEAARFYEMALSELENWDAPSGLRGKKTINEIRFRSDLLALDPGMSHFEKVLGLLELEEKLKMGKVEDGQLEESLVRRVEILRAASRFVEKDLMTKVEIREEFADRIKALTLQIEARLAKTPGLLNLEIYRCVIGGVRRDFLAHLGMKNLTAATEVAARWTELHQKNENHFGILRKRVVSLAELARSQGQLGEFDAAVESIESAGRVWEALTGMQSSGYGSETEATVIAVGVELMRLIDSKRPDLTLRVVASSKPILNHTMPYMYADREVEGFIPPELWTVYAKGRKYEARALVTAGKLDDAWGAYYGCSRRLRKLCRMSPSDPAPMILRCELLAEWIAMPLPPSKAQHPGAAQETLRKLVAKTRSMALNEEQKKNLEELEKEANLR